MKQLSVGLGERAYPVLVGQGLASRLDELDPVAKVLAKKRVVCVTDRSVHALHGERVEPSLMRACGEFAGWSIMEPGEPHKTVETLGRIWDDLVAFGIDRGGMVVALGGGVVGDVAGFAAATYLRGIDFVQLPTTLLAMVDSSVGGKTGVDHPRGKNLIGAFHQPRAVVADLDLLATLPRRETLSGLAEVIKAAILADAGLFDLLEQKGPGIVDDDEALADAVARAVAVKADVVARDEREGGPRALLNLGHTLGHAVETASGYGTFTHGEAVAMGMVFATKMAKTLGEIERQDAQRIETLIDAWGYPLLNRVDAGVDKIKTALEQDKKRREGSVRWVLPQGVGRAKWDCPVEKEIVDRLLTEAVGK